LTLASHRWCVICGAHFWPDREGYSAHRLTCSDCCEAAFEQQELQAAEQMLSDAVPRALEVLGYSSIDEYAAARAEALDTQGDRGDCLTGIYFVQAGEDGPIKIGYSVDIKRRISELATASPYPLRLLGYMRGDGVRESEIQNSFARYRIHGEWFFPSWRLKKLIHQEAVQCDFDEGVDG